MFRLQNNYQRCVLLVLIAILNSTLLVLYFFKSNQIDSVAIINLDDLKYVIQLSDEDKCVAVATDNTLVVAFCNMRTVKPFVYENGILKSVENGLCVSARVSNIRVLELSGCEEAINLKSVNSTLVQSTHGDQKPETCVTALKKGKVSRFPEVGSPIALAPCHKTVISIDLIKETQYIEDILTPPPAPTKPQDIRTCDSTHFPGCDIVGRFRIQFSHEGKCLGISKDNTLEVSFCNPRVSQAFFYSKGIFMSIETALCIGVNRSNLQQLMLTHCDDAVRLLLVDGELRAHTSLVLHRQTCVSPSTKTEPTYFPELGSKVSLQECKRPASHIGLLEESEFLKDRAALLMTLPQNDSCNFPGCAINKRLDFPQLIETEEVGRCENLSDCVTIVVKTARRPHFVIRLAQSVREFLDQDLPIIVIDDGPEPHPPEIMDQLAQFKNLKYIIAETADIGIAEGRTRGVKMVKTEYFLNLDDDHMIPNNSGIRQMVELMEKTDLSLVGARGKNSWAGFVDFLHDEDGQPIMRQLHGSCVTKTEAFPFKNECHRCDLTITVFIARTAAILEVGGWSRELKVCEHVDIFLRLKAADKKVAICANFHYIHDPNTEGLTQGKNETIFDKKEYRKLRWNRTKQMGNRFLSHWNVVKFKKISQADRKVS